MYPLNQKMLLIISLGQQGKLQQFEETETLGD